MKQQTESQQRWKAERLKRQNEFNLGTSKIYVGELRHKTLGYTSLTKGHLIAGDAEKDAKQIARNKNWEFNGTLFEITIKVTK